MCFIFERSNFKRFIFERFNLGMSEKIYIVPIYVPIPLSYFLDNT